MKTILVSKLKQSEKVYPVRTKKQRETVQRITETPDFDFACGNPFMKEVDDYVGTFFFTYYTRNQVLHLVRISPTGRITKEVEV